MVDLYSDRSACSTSTRDARAAGISDAAIAAAISTAAAPSSDGQAWHPQLLEVARRDAGEQIPERGAGDDADR